MASSLFQAFVQSQTFWLFISPQALRRAIGPFLINGQNGTRRRLRMRNALQKYQSREPR